MIPDFFKALKELGLKTFTLILVGKIYNRAFDFTYGLDTKPHLDQIKAMKQGLKINETYGSSKYSDSSLLALRKLFSSLNLKPENTFLDIGCGKGIVLIAALEQNLKKIKGFDHSQYLCNIASNNCSAYQRKLDKIITLEINCLSGDGYEFEDDEDILYFYNPFSEKTTENFITSIEESLARNRRDILIITHKWPGKDNVLERLKPSSKRRYIFWGKIFDVFQINPT